MSAVYKDLERKISFDKDYILNELSIKCKHAWLPLLHIMFNNIFECGYFLEAWSKLITVQGEKNERHKQP